MKPTQDKRKLEAIRLIKNWIDEVENPGDDYTWDECSEMVLYRLKELLKYLELK
jgi:hypothetical protein